MSARPAEYGDGHDVIHLGGENAMVVPCTSTACSQPSGSVPPSGGGPCSGVMLSPGKIGDITKAALVLVQFEHKMIS